VIIKEGLLEVACKKGKVWLIVPLYESISEPLCSEDLISPPFGRSRCFQKEKTPDKPNGENDDLFRVDRLQYPRLIKSKVKGASAISLRRW
jgi:hypothetical protein